jgi:hypothetical protein
MGDDPGNCIVVHCKGGKGRTGVMVCAWLLYTRFLPTAAEAMRWFACARTNERRARAAQGVSQPSQRRYVRYAQTVVEEGGYRAPTLRLRGLVLRTCPHVDDDGGCNPWFTVEENGAVVYDLREHQDEYLQVRFAGACTRAQARMGAHVLANTRAGRRLMRACTHMHAHDTSARFLAQPVRAVAGYQIWVTQCIWLWH